MILRSFIILSRWQSITWSMPLRTRTVSYPARRRYSWLRPLHGAHCVPSLDIKGISAFHSHAYPCRKDRKGLMRIYSQSRLFSFLTKAAQAGAWISSRSPKLKRERQQLCCWHKRSLCWVCPVELPTPSSPKGVLSSSCRAKEKKNIFRGKFIWLRDMFFFDLRRSLHPVQPDGLDCVSSLY